jgi:hypothetical protein
MAEECFSFLQKIHGAPDSPIPLNKLSAVDVCYWRTSGHVVRSYGPAGEYDR